MIPPAPPNVYADRPSGIRPRAQRKPALGPLVAPPLPEALGVRNAPMLVEPNGVAFVATRLMKAEVVSGPIVTGDELGLRIRVEHDGNVEEFRVRVYAPGLYDYAPYFEGVRKAIAQVLADHEAELEAIFARMG